jgi:hypothetical protein
VNKRVSSILKNHGKDFFSRIGKLGFQSTCDRYFEGDREAMKRWLVRMGQWTVDQGTTYAKPEVFRFPGLHPAEVKRMKEWLEHTEANIKPYNGPNE